MEANTSNDTSNNGSNNGKETKRQQFTNKQRMDMYAFCVLELEMHSNKVSIKKQQQAIQKVLNEQHKDGQAVPPSQLQQPHQQQQPPTHQQPHLQQSLDDQQQHHLQQPTILLQNGDVSQTTQHDPQPIPQQHHHHHHQQQQQQHQEEHHPDHEQQQNEIIINLNNNGNGLEGKTLLQLQQEVAMTRKCYSDYQKTQVLTSSMLREVQKRFAKYYPDSAIPSRTTIKHVFEKCVAHGTVENIKTPRKATKIPQGDEIEYLLIHEPQLSLRQMAQKLNVSTGTVSRRCKALGLIPESVTIKHQQLATARRQKQIKQLESQSKASF